MEKLWFGRCFDFRRSRQKKDGQKRQEKGRGGWKGSFRRWGISKTQQNLPQQAIDYNQYRLTFFQWSHSALLGLGVCGITAYTFYRSWVALAVLAPMGLIYPFWHKQALCSRRKEQLKSEFKEGILILAGLLAAGYSMENALEAGITELTALYGSGGMLVKEFVFMTKQIKLNCTAEQVLENFAERSGIEEVGSFVQVFIVAKRGGGDLVSIMNRTAESIRDKIQVFEEIRTMTAARRYEQRIMNLLPFLIILYVDFTSPGFFNLIYTSVTGRILMTICLGVYAAAFWLSGKILDIEVS